VIDSFKPRGIKETTRDQDQISSTAMLADAMATLRAVANRPEIDGSRIGLIGYSKGGTVASKLALKRYARRSDYDGRDFALLIAMYPWCGDLPLDFTPAGAPLVMMLGAADTYTGLDSCKEFAARFEKAGGIAQVEIMKGAQHGWDVPGSRDWRVADGQNASKCIYDEISAGTWVERTSRIVVAKAGKPTSELKDAKKRCMTLGVSGGYNREAHAQSMALVAQAIRQSLRTK
jgi:dienelactone hydrolase